MPGPERVPAPPAQTPAHFAGCMARSLFPTLPGAGALSHFCLCTGAPTVCRTSWMGRAPTPAPEGEPRVGHVDVRERSGDRGMSGQALGEGIQRKRGGNDHILTHHNVDSFVMKNTRKPLM